MGNDILYDTVLRIILKIHLSNISIEPRVVVSFFSLSFFVLNSFLNPLIYAIRMRQFCVAFNELCRTANVSLVQKTKITSNKLITTWSSLLYCVAIVQKIYSLKWSFWQYFIRSSLFVQVRSIRARNKSYHLRSFTELFPHSRKAYNYNFFLCEMLKVSTETRISNLCMATGH